MTNPKARRRVSTRRGKPKIPVQRIEAELPPELRQYAQRMRKGLGRLEKQIASAQAGARRRWAQLLREASHQLGRIEALGEREWRKRTTRARKDAVKLLRRLEKAIEPGGAAPRRKPARRTARSKTAPATRHPVAARRDSALPAVTPASAAAPPPTA